MYVGAKLHNTRLHHEVWTWVISPMKYVQLSVRNCEAHLGADYSDIYRLPQKAEMDISPDLRPHAAAYFQSIIHIPRWMIEIKKIDLL